jgi:virulence-associated protein VapD
MLVLIFNTTTKTVEVIYENGVSKTYDDVPTVAIMEGFYEIRQTDLMEDKRFPVLRLPISQTVMEIKR